MDEGGDKGGPQGYNRRNQRKEDWAKKMRLDSTPQGSDESEDEKCARKLTRR